MIIDESSLQYWIDHFYGYGDWNANIWFVGYEEGGGELPEEVAEKLNYFSAVHAASSRAELCEIRDLYRHVTYRDNGPKGKAFGSLFDYRFGTDGMLHGAWKNLIAFAHGFRQEDPPDLLTYQKNYFLREREAMVQLYPLPSPHSHAWYYSWQVVSEPLAYIRNRERYEKHVFPRRIETIIDQILKHKPALVLMYGMNNIDAIKESFGRVYPARFKMVKAIKLQLPQHHVAAIGDTRLLITTQVPTLRHNRAETGFNWYYFGTLVRSYA